MTLIEHLVYKRPQKLLLVIDAQSSAHLSGDSGRRRTRRSIAPMPDHGSCIFCSMDLPKTPNNFLHSYGTHYYRHIILAYNASMYMSFYEPAQNENRQCLPAWLTQTQGGFP